MYLPLVLLLLLATRCFSLPLSFEERGQGHYLSRSSSGTMEFLASRVVSGDVTLRFVGTSGAEHLEGFGPAAPST